MDLQRAWRLADRVAAGRRATERVDLPDDAALRRAFRVTGVLLAAGSAISAASLATAVVLAEERHVVGVPVWIRCTAIMGISLTLFYFAWRARLGYRWAYRRLRLFSRVFPVVALVLASIPGLFPVWVVAEQLVFAALLIGVAVALGVRPVRGAFGRPETA